MGWERVYKDGEGEEEWSGRLGGTTFLSEEGTAGLVLEWGFVPLSSFGDRL